MKLIAMMLFILTQASVAEALSKEDAFNILLGSYPVLDWNHEQKTGILTVIKDNSLIGFETSNLDMASNPVPILRIATPVDKTHIIESNNVITQEYIQEQGSSIHVEYDRLDGYMFIKATDCTKGTCQVTSLVVSSGKSPGELLDSREFFASLSGSYIISLAGGIPPEGDNNMAEIDANSDHSEALLYFPFCLPIGCDLGFANFPYNGTHVYRRTIEKSHFVYDIFKGEDPLQKRYSWETFSEKSIFRNYQYNLNNKTVCLEHVVTKAR